MMKDKAEQIIQARKRLAQQIPDPHHRFGGFAHETDDPV